MGPHQKLSRLHEAWMRSGVFGFPHFPFGGPWPGGRGGHAGRGWGGGGRARRHNVRAAVLALLAERPMHGYEMIQELASRTGGVWRPSPGSIYPTLQLLEDEGLIVGTVDESGGGRKRFTLTDAGREEAASVAPPPWEEFAPETISSWTEIRDAGFQAMNALRQVLMNGTDEQRARAAQVLDETRRKLYAILAEID